MGTKEERNMEVVRKAIEAFNRQNLEEYFACHTEDATSHEVYYPEPLNLKDQAEFVPQLWHSYPDWHIETKALVAMGDSVAVENIMTATFERDFGDQKATGKSFVVREGVFFDMKDGKIQHVRVYLDRRSQEEQLGTTSLT
ncbi:MAG TPA: ester cyclase [Nitrospiraceae bacterium]|nr:ester cyclase [Nitrospiraceae bacterium]